MELEDLLSEKYYYNEEKVSHYFHELCSKELQSMRIKKLFLKLDYREKLNNKVLTSGLLGALENHQETYVPLIINHMEKFNIKPDFYTLTNALVIGIEKKNDTAVNTIFEYLEKSDLNLDKDFHRLEVIFNAATSSNNHELAKKIDEKYSVIEKSINGDMGEEYIDLVRGAHSAFASLNSYGSLFIGGSMGGEQSSLENKLDYYSLNPILFNLKNFNAELLDTFFKNDYEVHPSVVTHALVSSVYLNNSEAVLYLFANEKSAKIITNSTQLRAFINSDADFADRKKEARIALSMIELNNELGDNNNSKNKMKI